MRKFFWTKIIPIDLMCRFRDWLGPNRLGRLSRRILFPAGMCPGYDFFNFYLNNKTAEWVRYNSVERPHTQRALASAFKKEFPDSNVVDGCQYDGRWLQEYCEDYLKIRLNEEQEKSSEYKESITNTAKRLKELFNKFNV